MKKGDQVTDFTLPDETGTPRALSEFLADGPVVLFFYPAAMTPGCTAESCHFRDLATEFKEAGGQRVGISSDGVETQSTFSTRYGLDFPLLSDSDGAVSKEFGVRRSFGPLPTKRQTFVIDTDRTVLEIIKSEIRMNVHADKALEALKARKSS